MKKIIAGLLLLSLAGVTWGGVSRGVTLKLIGDEKGTRAFADLPVAKGEALKGAVSFDIAISDPSVIRYFVCYFRSGAGWYKTTFEPTREDEIQSNRVYHVEVPRTQFRVKEDSPAGWDQVDRIRFAAYPLQSKPAEIKISNLTFGKPTVPSAAERAARAAMVRERLAAMPGKAGERRFIWCHYAWGMSETNDWNSTCRLAKENGFTDLIVNLAWGGCAFYPSQVLPPPAKGPRGDMLEACKAACRQNGLKMHVWKVCWRQGGYSAPAIAAAQKKAGRSSADRRGKAKVDWNCPSHPANQQLEIDAMLELALEKGVDGIHFDYIRYGGDVCFCDGCRARFEKQIGHRVAHWPEDIGVGGPLFDAWNRFRCGNITTVVKTVAEKVRKVRPEVEISAAVFPLPAMTPASIGQDWVSWSRAGWLDFVCPMNYTEFPLRFAAQVRTQRDALKGLKTRLYPGLAIECSHFGRTDALAPAREIEEVRKAGLDGFTLFHLGVHAAEILPQLRKGPLRE